METLTYKARAVDQYDFTSEDKLFLDANIWLHLFAPHDPPNSDVRTYSDVFDRILEVESQIYIDVLVVSEFINAYARREWRFVRPRPDFKVFRNSSAFKPVAQKIAIAVKQIMKHSSRIESGFGTFGIDNLLNDYATGGFDFNDQVITEICKKNDFTLITNDGDFKTQEIPILTANPKLLDDTTDRSL